jgi:hypothetical protein
LYALVFGPAGWFQNALKLNPEAVAAITKSVFIYQDFEGILYIAREGYLEILKLQTDLESSIQIVRQILVLKCELKQGVDIWTTLKDLRSSIYRIGFPLFL